MFRFEAFDAGVIKTNYNFYTENTRIFIYSSSLTINNEKWEFDVVIASPNVMAKIAKIGKVLGPRNLMPNPKSGTVTPEVGKAVGEVKKGKIAFKVDKFGIVHTSVGRVSFSAAQINENASTLLQTLAKLKPATAKGIYFKGISMASTMSPGINVDSKSVEGLN